MSPKKMLSKNFSYDELACQCGCGLIPKEDLITKLQILRTRLNRALIVTSGARCEEHNNKIGGAKNSQHVKGLAVDIKALSGSEKYELINEGMKLGFRGVGVHDLFIHLDLRNESPVAFLYKGGK